MRSLAKTIKTLPTRAKGHDNARALLQRGGHRGVDSHLAHFLTAKRKAQYDTV